MNKEFYLIAHNIRSLHNVGSMFRTADAFQINKVFLCGYTGEPPRDQITKVALGADKTVPWEKIYYIKPLLKKLTKQGVQIYSLETGKNSTSIYNYKPKFPCALIVGNEVDGIPANILNQSDTILSIPMLGMKESLNVSIATGIALYALNQYR